MPPTIEPQYEAECYTYLKVTTDSISVSDTSDSQSYAPAVSFRRSRVTFSNFFQVFLGSESLEDFIGRVITPSLSWDEAAQTLTVKSLKVFENIRHFPIIELYNYCKISRIEYIVKDATNC